MMMYSCSVNCFIDWLINTAFIKKKVFNTRHLSLSFRVASLKHSSVFPTAIISRTSGCTFRLQQNTVERKLHYFNYDYILKKKIQKILTMIKWSTNEDWASTCGEAFWTCDLWRRTKDMGTSLPVPGNPRPFSRWVDFPQ